MGLKGTFPLFLCLVIQDRPAQSPPTFRKGGTTQPGAFCPAAKIHGRSTIRTLQICKQGRNLGGGDRPLFVQIQDAVTLGIAKATEERAETALSHLHRAVAFRTGYVGVLGR